MARLLSVLALALLAAPALASSGDPRIRFGIPDGGIDPVEDPAQGLRSLAQQSAQPHTPLISLNLDRIGRRDCCDAIGELQAGLQKSDVAIALDAVD